MVKLDERVLVHSIDYYPYVGEDKYHQPSYGAKQTISKCRVDLTYRYMKNSSEQAKDIYAIVFCYAGYTEPFTTFTAKSKAVLADGKETIIAEVIPVPYPYSADLFAYELELV